MGQSQRAAVKTPLVSIGMPVFNGEGLVEGAIRSVLAQTFPDLELIICDNGSGDRTAEICRAHAAGEPRIRYFRKPRNSGAAGAYNLAVSCARGRYFKWLDHDDRLHTTYLERTRQVLEEREDVVLCNTAIVRIDPTGGTLGVHDSGLARADLPSAAARFGFVLATASCVDFFGLMRIEALRGSRLLGNFPGAERALLAQLALKGRLAQLPAPLCEMREYPHLLSSWQEAGRIVNSARLRAEYLRMLRRESLPAAERLRCVAALAGHFAHSLTRRHALQNVAGASTAQASQVLAERGR
jgi:hypothetical protein